VDNICLQTLTKKWLLGVIFVRCPHDIWEVKTETWL